VWTRVLATPDTPNLKQAPMTELATYLGSADVPALEARCGDSYLDSGGGVGSGAILFACHGYTVAQVDISSTLLDFSKWRFARRQVAA
jgi:2-polyprenyl-3-methyl-5-hydroxy-6-metoxy-1,4-benzoquinol methylase